MGTSPQFVTDYILHVRALRRHEESYQSLLGEIAEFQPQPLSDDEKRHVDAMKQHLYALNPGKDLRPIVIVSLSTSLIPYISGTNDSVID